MGGGDAAVGGGQSKAGCGLCAVGNGAGKAGNLSLALENFFLVPKRTRGREQENGLAKLRVEKKITHGNQRSS